MSGALAGLRIDGQNKWLRLHGARRACALLAQAQAVLQRHDEAGLRAYARQLQAVELARDPYPTPLQRLQLQEFFAARGDAQPPLLGWAEVFARFDELQGWLDGLPYMPAAPLHACGDVDWGVLLDLDAGALYLYDNRHARLNWQDLDVAAAAHATLALRDARQLQPDDLTLIEELLHQHAPTEGEVPATLPARSGLWPLPPIAGWQPALQLAQGRASLLLQRASLRLRIARAHGLRLHAPGVDDAVRSALPAQVLALTVAIYGPEARLSELARVAVHRAQLPFDPSAAGLPLLALGLQTSNGLALPLGAGYFDALRACFLQAGMTPQGWRFLLRQQAPVLRFLLQFYPPSARILGDFARFINLVASALQSEPLQLERAHAALRGVERILDRTRGRPSDVRQENARIFLRALMRARLGPEQLANLAHDAQDVSDFVYTQAQVLKGATWRSLCRRSEAWHRALLITVDPHKDVRWPALLPRFACGPYTALELDCGALLAEEGLEQRHCVGSYVNACSSGASRIFSLRRQGKRVATIELQRDHAGDWVLVQIRGKANAVIRDPAILAAGQAVARAYAEAARTQGEAKEPPPKAVVSSIHTALPGYLIHRQEHWTG